MEELTVTYKLVTPLVMGGADPNERAELRVPSIKGVLRYWYRAADPEYKEHQGEIFGGIGEGQGQSAFLLRIERPVQSEATWPPPQLGHNDCQELRYFAYSLTMGGNNRRYIGPGQEIRLRLLFRQRPEERARRAVAASLWLLGHVGGLGARCRRGFGTVSRWQWQVTRGERWPELQDLRLASGAATPDQWIQLFKEGCQRLRAWFGTFPASPDHTVLGPGTRVCLVRHPFHSGPVPAWAGAMDRAAGLLRRFRNRRDVNDRNSDYHRVREHLCRVDPVAARNARNNGEEVRPRDLDRAPDRAAFGLPLTFRYKSLGAGPGDKWPPEITFQGEATDRSASRLWVRVVEMGGACYPLFVWLPGPLLPPGSRVRWKLPGGRRGEVSPPGDGIVDAFFNSLGAPVERL